MIKVLSTILLTYILCACTAANNIVRTQALSYPYSANSYSSINNYRQLARKVESAYVKVSIQTKQADADRNDTGASRTVSGASGIIISTQGHVVTAAHIAQNTALQAQITAMDGQVFNAEILHVEPTHELALLKINAPGTVFLKPIITKSVYPGEAVLAIGTPDNKPGVVSVGTILNPGLKRKFDYGDYGFMNPLSLAMKVEPGHSGGPVFNSKGALVGMIVAFDLRLNTAGDYDATGTAYAVDIKDVMNFVDTALSQ